MGEASRKIGSLIRQFRQSKALTIEELAERINKSRATLSKYEKGDIVLDVDTLYDISDALGIQAEQLLYRKNKEFSFNNKRINPGFFQNIEQFYAYFYDGRNKKINRSIIDIIRNSDVNSYEVAMYMNCSDLNNYNKSENTYWGFMEHYDTMTLLEVTNQDTPTEKASIQILASFLDAEVKWGLWNGVSSRPLMPVALKMLFSKKALKEDKELVQLLKVSKEDYQNLKYYNFFCVF